jgi:hypothetical protein
MDLTRRFVFRGNASAVAGQIYRPKTIIVDVKGGASSLGVSGGRSQSQIGGASFGDIIKFGSAFTQAEGRFDDEKRAAAVTDHKGKQSELSTTTTVTAETREISVGIKPLVTIKRARATLISRSPRGGSGEPSITPTRDTTIQGVIIAGNELSVTLNVAFFQKYDTRSKVLAAADDRKCFERYGNHFVSGATVEGRSVGRGGLISHRGTIYATLVQELKWASGKPPSHARIDGHSVVVKDFGTVYLAEMLISEGEVRVTMARVELGSPIGGYCDFVDVGSNGGGFP